MQIRSSEIALAGLVIALGLILLGPYFGLNLVTRGPEQTAPAAQKSAPRRQESGVRAAPTPARIAPERAGNSSSESGTSLDQIEQLLR